MLHRMDGLQIQDEAIRADQDTIKAKHLELQYLERDMELSLKSHESILKQAQSEVEALKGRMSNMLDMQEAMRRDLEFKRQQQKDTDKKNEQTYADQVSEKLRDFEGRVALVEVKMNEEVNKLVHLDKKITQCSSSIKEQEIKNFKTEVRISQVENRVETNERRLSTDSRRLGTLEDTPMDNNNFGSKPINIQRIVQPGKKSNMSLNDSNDGPVNSGLSAEAVREIMQESLDELKKEFSILYLTQYSLDQTESKVNLKIEAL